MPGGGWKPGGGGGKGMPFSAGGAAIGAGGGMLVTGGAAGAGMSRPIRVRCAASWARASAGVSAT